MAPALCPKCGPQDETADVPSPEHLTKLARDILDYVLEAALIHFEHEYPPYRLCVGDIAACFAKTPGQLSSALDQLEVRELIIVQGRSTDADLRDARTMIYPTLAALRTQASLAGETDMLLQQELDKLHAASSS
jgi:hypothetical protein